MHVYNKPSDGRACVFSSIIIDDIMSKMSVIDNYRYYTGVTTKHFCLVNHSDSHFNAHAREWMQPQISGFHYRRIVKVQGLLH